MARRRRRRFGLLMKIPKGAYQKALKKVQASRRKWRGKRSLPAGADPATNRDRAVVEAYRFQHRKRAAPFMALPEGGEDRELDWAAALRHHAT